MKIPTKAFYDYVVHETDYELFVEVGAGNGASVALLAKNLTDTEREFVIFAIDNWSMSERQAYNILLRSNGVRNEVCDMICTEAQALTKFSNASIDVCLLRNPTKESLALWKTKVTKKGLLAYVENEDVVVVKKD